MHTTNYMDFIRERGAFVKKILSQWGRSRPSRESATDQTVL